MARRTRTRKLSKRMASGLVFIITGIVGGFITSVGIDIYHTLKTAVLSENGFPVSIPQILFLLIGIAGLGLLLSGVVAPPPRPRMKKKS